MDRFDQYDKLFLEVSQQFEAHSDNMEQDDGLDKLLIEVSQQYETSTVQLAPIQPAVPWSSALGALMI